MLKRTTAERHGSLPLRSRREGTVGSLPPAFPSHVIITRSTYVLTFVESVETISTGPIVGRDVVDCWILDNGRLEVKVIQRGGSVVSIEQGGREYLWQNKAGATYFGASSNTFPLVRGLILHGGIHVGAVTPEHGLYYDTDWDIEFAADDGGSSIILKIQDTEENRALLADTLSTGEFSIPGSPIPMGKYPVTDAEFVFTIRLQPGEDFVRIEVALVNTRTTPIDAEIWLPQTYPVSRDSQIISHQVKRRCKDDWVYQAMLEGNVEVSEMTPDARHGLPQYAGKHGLVLETSDLNKPLEWPTAVGGILYDYPWRDGPYHAVSFGDGRGAAYVSVSTPEDPHYTKMWSWGSPDLYDRREALAKTPPLPAGRPRTAYYEPWASRFNTGFFEPHRFAPGASSWYAYIVPIDSGLGPEKPQAELRKAVDQKVEGIL